MLLFTKDDVTASQPVDITDIGDSSGDFGKTFAICRLKMRKKSSHTDIMSKLKECKFGI